jgi:hypothetical protein
MVIYIDLQFNRGRHVVIVNSIYESRSRQEDSLLHVEDIETGG